MSCSVLDPVYLEIIFWLSISDFYCIQAYSHKLATNSYCPKYRIYFLEWSDFGDWSDCSTVCGDGIQTRFRTCPVGYKCEGKDSETQSCNLKPCPGETFCCFFAFVRFQIIFSCLLRLLRFDVCIHRVSCNIHVL